MNRRQYKKHVKKRCYKSWRSAKAAIKMAKLISSNLLLKNITDQILSNETPEGENITHCWHTTMRARELGKSEYLNDGFMSKLISDQ